MSDYATEMISIRLPGGWSGRVMTGTTHALRPDAVPLTLPTIERWRSELVKLVSDPASLPGYETLKYSKDGEVFRARIEFEGRGADPETQTNAIVRTRHLDVIGKHSRVHGLGRRLAAVFGRTRERRNFALGLTLQRASINTATPLALIQRRRPHREAWLVTMYLEDVMDLDQVAMRVLPSLGGRETKRVKGDIIEAIVDTLVRLERNGFTHRDFKASNILVRDVRAALCSGELERSGPSASVWLVDLDGLKRCRWRRVSRKWQPIVRLAASLLDCSAVTHGDYARFLKSYLAHSESTGNNWRVLYAKLAVQASQYVSRAARRKSEKLDGFTGEG